MASEHTDTPQPIGHYENFPVASWLCPPHLRAPIAAIYHFARTADDLADEGQASAAERLRSLHLFRQCLWQQATPQAQWQALFEALHRQVQRFGLPMDSLDALLDAFEQDVRKTAAGEGYADRAELLEYCRRSANPVGRLLLHLYGTQGGAALQQSDAICTALQLINFWQDLRQDIPRGRWYIPEADLQAFGITREMQRQAIAQNHQSPALTALLRQQVQWARDCMAEGLALPAQLPGRAGWELRLVVQGGLRVLGRIERGGFDSYVRRPRLGWADWLVVGGKSLTMRWR
ncbi:squalene synthase HpnC [Corticibacter populi]|nr:squalene synthase HpnC [Corticibacter populi]